PKRLHLAVEAEALDHFPRPARSWRSPPLAHEGPDSNGFENGQVGKRSRDLKGARDAGGAQPRRTSSGDVGAEETHRSTVGGERTGDDVEQCRLARAVRAHETKDTALLDLERN